MDIKNLTRENISDEEVEGPSRVENRRTKTIFSESAKKYKVYTNEFGADVIFHLAVCWEGSQPFDSYMHVLSPTKSK